MPVHVRMCMACPACLLCKDPAADALNCLARPYPVTRHACRWSSRWPSVLPIIWMRTCRPLSQSVSQPWAAHRSQALVQEQQSLEALYDGAILALIRVTPVAFFRVHLNRQHRPCLHKPDQPRACTLPCTTLRSGRNRQWGGDTQGVCCCWPKLGTWLYNTAHAVCCQATDSANSIRMTKHCWQEPVQ